jgi:hypothetical protein
LDVLDQSQSDSSLLHDIEFPMNEKKKSSDSIPSLPISLKHELLFLFLFDTRAKAK